MARQRNKRNGSKIGGSHTTVIDGTAHIIDFITSDRRVTKIILGHISMLNRHSSGGLHVKCADPNPAVEGGNGCVHVRIAFGCGAQDIYVYLVHPATRCNFCKRLKRYLKRDVV